MFGTVGRAHVKPENRENEVILVAMFEDADSYWENADDPAQHQRYLEYRALMEDEPEWSDGEWHEAVSS